MNAKDFVWLRKGQNEERHSIMILDELGPENTIFMDRETHKVSPEVTINVVKGDITQREVDAIVNAAHRVSDFYNLLDNWAYSTDGEKEKD